MGNRDKLRERLRRKPTPKDIKWKELDSFLKSLGFTPKEGSGSRVKYYLKLENGGIRQLNLHRNHPSPEVGPGAIEDVVKLLKELGFL